MSRFEVSTKPESGNFVDPARDERAVAGDQRDEDGTNGRNGVTNGGAKSALATNPNRVQLIYGAIAVVTLAVCTINALSLHADITRFGGRAIEGWKPFVWEWTSGLTIVALTPLIRRAVLWTMVAGRSLAAIILLHLAGAAAFLAAHLAGFVVLRNLVYSTLGAGRYNFAFSGSNILYEARKDVIIYAMLAGIFWAARLRLDVKPETRHIAVVSPEPLPRELWLRDGTTSVRVDPKNIVWVASAGNYIEYCVDGGQKHLVRGTLTNEEERLARFGLVRVHRTRLVNAKRVKRITGLASGGFEAEMDTGKVIAGSRRFRAQLSALPTQ